MRYPLFFSFLFSSFVIFSQSELEKNSIIRLRLAYGKVNSYMGNTGEVDFDICDLPQCKFDGFYFTTVPTNYFNGIVMLIINKKNSFGVGFIATQHGKRQVLTTGGKATYHMDYLLEYYGFNIKYQKDFLFSKRLKLGIANAIEFEHLSQMEYGVRDLYSKGKSWASELIFTFSITKRIALDLSFIYKIALEKYGPTSWSGEFHRTGSGILLGVSYGI